MKKTILKRIVFLLPKHPKYFILNLRNVLKTYVLKINIMRFTKFEKYKVSYQGGYFHIYSRGNNKQNIFLEDADYLKYLEKLREYKEKHNISIICYCLMPNHIHLLLCQNSKTPISKFMASLHTSYSMNFNWKHNKVGHVFQGRFKQKEVNKDDYLLQVSFYIHFNPVKDGLVKKLEDYKWSSYSDYIGLRDGTLCDKELILMGGTSKDYRKNIEERLKDELIKDVLFKDVP